MGNMPHFTPRVPDIDDFGTVLQCMDGRPQRKVMDYLTTSLGVRYIDTITTAGLVRHLAEPTDRTSRLMADLDVSVEAHGSRKIAVAAHHDCAGNPASDSTQKHQVGAAIVRLADAHPGLEVVGLWLGENWIVERVRAG